MKPHLSPERVMVTEAVERDERARARADRMIAAMTPGEVLRDVSFEALDALSAERGWTKKVFWGERERAARVDPDVIFSCYNPSLDEAGLKALAERYPNLRVNDVLDGRPLKYRPDGHSKWRRNENRVCQPAWQFHSITGCPFRCDYCWFGNVINCRVNIEDAVGAMDDLIRTKRPPQTIWKWDNNTDTICFEPEYDATRPLVEYFARQNEHYLLIYAGKSDNVDFLLDYEHRGQTILQWSLGPRTQTERIEEKTAAWDERVESMARCEAAGYHVRFRLSPIIPVRGWREEYAELLERVFDRCHPDVVALCPFGWMDYSEAERRVDLSLWDPEIVDVMRAAAPFLAGKRYGPAPHEARARIHDFLIGKITALSPRTPIALCLETPGMWAEFEGRLDQGADEYVCVCGPYCTPGNHQFRCREAEEVGFLPRRGRA